MPQFSRGEAELETQVEEAELSLRRFSEDTRLGELTEGLS
jgi:hypothetical protein